MNYPKSIKTIHNITFEIFKFQSVIKLSGGSSAMLQSFDVSFVNAGNTFFGFLHTGCSAAGISVGGTV